MTIHGVSIHTFRFFIFKNTKKCEDEELENVYEFKHLGSIFAADDQERSDVEARIAMLKKTCGQLRHVFDSPHIGS